MRRPALAADRKRGMNVRSHHLTQTLTQLQGHARIGIDGDNATQRPALRVALLRIVGKAGGPASTNRPRRGSASG